MGLSIRARLITGLHFTQREPPARDLAAYVARGVWHAPPCRARIKLFASAEVAAERWPPAIGLIDERSCFFEVGAASFEGLAAHIASFGVDFEVDQPPELVDHVRRLSSRLSRAAGTLGSNRTHA